jgi:hypothetical protein
MDRTKKIGIMFIIVGFFIPLVFYPFTELTEDVKDKAAALLAFRGVKYTPRLSELKVDTWGFPSIIAIGLASIFTGISIIVLSRNRHLKKPKPETSADPLLHKAEGQSSEKAVKKVKEYIAVDEGGKAVRMLECPECDFSVNEEKFTESAFFCPNCKSRLEYG